MGLLTVFHHVFSNKTFLSSWIKQSCICNVTISSTTPYLLHWDSMSWGGPQWITQWTFGGLTTIPNAMVAIRTRRTESALVNDEIIESFTEGCVPLVYMSTSLNWGRSGYPIGWANSCFMYRRKSRYSLAQVSCCWQKWWFVPYWLFHYGVLLSRAWM